MSIITSPARTRKPSRRKYTPTTQRKRSVVLAAWHADLQAGALRITEEGKTDVYFLARQESDYGQAFRIEKWRKATADIPAGCEEPYHVCIAGKQSSCECKGHLRFGHCRHVESLTALINAKKL